MAVGNPTLCSSSTALMVGATAMTLRPASLRPRWSSWSVAVFPVPAAPRRNPRSRPRESASTSDRQQAERFLRDRLDARDDGVLATVLTSKQLTFSQWADWFLERRSKPPFRSAGNHQQNVNALKFLRPVFGELALSEITAEAVENYLGDPSSPDEGYTQSSEFSCAGGSNRQLPIRSSGFCRTS
jgi:hypothetical protein